MYTQDGNEEQSGRREPAAEETAAGATAKGVQADAEHRPVPQDTEAQARFEALVTEHLDGLYRSALRLAKHRPAAEDLVQDVMFKAWRSFQTFQEGTSVRAWLHKILMNAFFDTYRKGQREPETVDVEDVGEFYLYDKVTGRADLAEAGNPEFQVLDQIMDSEVRDSLESLPAQFRAAVILADLEGFSYKEMAGILGIPEGTVMSRLSRGRHLLQHKLWNYARDRHYVKGDAT